jgi:HEAT repeat protein
MILGLRAALNDEEKAVRDQAALALFRLGQRDSGVLDPIAAVIRESKSSRGEFQRTWAEWQRERTEAEANPR